MSDQHASDYVGNEIRYHRKCDVVLRIEPDGQGRFLSLWETICYWFGARP